MVKKGQVSMNAKGIHIKCTLLQLNWRWGITDGSFMLWLYLVF